MNNLLQLADRVEKAVVIGEIDSLCRELHEIDEQSNVNGSCAGYVYDLWDAKRLIPPNHCYSISSDVNQVRAVVSVFLTEPAGGFSAVPHGYLAETRALVAAALRARADQAAA